MFLWIKKGKTKKLIVAMLGNCGSRSRWYITINCFVLFWLVCLIRVCLFFSFFFNFCELLSIYLSIYLHMYIHIYTYIIYLHKLIQTSVGRVLKWFFIAIDHYCFMIMSHGIKKKCNGDFNVSLESYNRPEMWAGWVVYVKRVIKKFWQG